jgi:hypothetical protein
MASKKAGNVVVEGIFEPGVVVELLERGNGDFRASGAIVARRRVDEHGDVGFDGLDVGERYFVGGISHGRRLEVRVVASEDADSFAQRPVQPTPGKLGTSSVPEPVLAAANPAGELEQGLPSTDARRASRRERSK